MEEVTWTDSASSNRLHSSLKHLRNRDFLLITKSGVLRGEFLFQAELSDLCPLFTKAEQVRSNQTAANTHCCLCIVPLLLGDPTPYFISIMQMSVGKTHKLVKGHNLFGRYYDYYLATHVCLYNIASQRPSTREQQTEMYSSCALSTGIPSAEIPRSSCDVATCVRDLSRNSTREGKGTVLLWSMSLGDIATSSFESFGIWIFGSPSSISFVQSCTRAGKSGRTNEGKDSQVLRR
jgi:hypothetical protein